MLKKVNGLMETMYDSGRVGQRILGVTLRRVPHNILGQPETS